MTGSHPDRGSTVGDTDGKPVVGASVGAEDGIEVVGCVREGKEDGFQDGAVVPTSVGIELGKAVEGAAVGALLGGAIQGPQ